MNPTQRMQKPAIEPQAAEEAAAPADDLLKVFQIDARYDLGYLRTKIAPQFEAEIELFTTGERLKRSFAWVRRGPDWLGVDAMTLTMYRLDGCGVATTQIRAVLPPPPTEYVDAGPLRVSASPDESGDAGKPQKAKRPKKARPEQPGKVQP